MFKGIDINLEESEHVNDEGEWLDISVLPNRDKAELQERIDKWIKYAKEGLDISVLPNWDKAELQERIDKWIKYAKEGILINTNE